jgi:anti-anti-sigma regulatory factor
VLELSRVEFVDSYGIRLLVMARRHAWERDMTVALRDGKPLVRALLDLVGIDPMYHPLDNSPTNSGQTTHNNNDD